MTGDICISLATSNSGPKYARIFSSQSKNTNISYHRAIHRVHLTECRTVKIGFTKTAHTALRTPVTATSTTPGAADR